MRFHIQTARPRETTPHSIPREREVRQRLYMAIRQAYETCHKNKDMTSCAVAWNEVEDLSRALYRIKTSSTAQARLCDSRPDHEECREYDV